MRTASRTHLARLALVSLAVAALITAVGFYAFVGSIHIPAAVLYTIQRIATPLLPVLDYTRPDDTSDIDGRVALFLGWLLWAVVIFVGLMLRSRARRRGDAA